MSLLPYKLELQWTGNKGRGTEQYTSYDRSYTIRCAGKEDLHLSSDPHFRGDAGLYNPEELLLMAAASCHMLWYLHLCADAGLIVESYHDLPTATLRIDEKGSGKFEKIELNPSVILRAGSDPELAQALHGKANQMCFIANSLNIKISHRPTLRISS